MQGLNAKAAFSSSYAPPGPSNVWIHLRKSIPRPMGDVSPTPRLAVAEAMGRNAATRGGMDPRGRWLLGAFWVLGGA